MPPDLPSSLQRSCESPTWVSRCRVRKEKKIWEEREEWGGMVMINSALYVEILGTPLWTAA